LDTKLSSVKNKYICNAKHVILAIVILTLIQSCKDNPYLLDLSPEAYPGAGTWLVNESYIQWGCSQKDCIPSLSSPSFVSADSPYLSYLDDNDLVIGIKDGDDYIAFPHPILDWHEVINGSGYSISYCPLTGSAFNIADDNGFGVSGLLYNSNLIMYDKRTDSYWPQMSLVCAAGSRRGENLPTSKMMETTWGTWRQLHPQTLAVSSNTGYDRNYYEYPYGSYKSNNAIFFPIENSLNTLPVKSRVLAIIEEEASKAFAISNFVTFSIHHTNVGGTPIVIFGSSVHNFAMAYKTDKQFQLKSGEISSGDLVFEDIETGSEWNIFGESTGGALTGQSLEKANSMIAFWFSVAAFYPEIEVMVLP
jgi:hypothetical protein